MSLEVTTDLGQQLLGSEWQDGHVGPWRRALPTWIDREHRNSLDNPGAQKDVSDADGKRGADEDHQVGGLGNLLGLGKPVVSMLSVVLVEEEDVSPEYRATLGSFRKALLGRGGDEVVESDLVRNQ